MLFVLCHCDITQQVQYDISRDIQLAPLLNYFNRHKAKIRSQIPFLDLESQTGVV